MTMTKVMEFKHEEVNSHDKDVLIDYISECMEEGGYIPEPEEVEEACECLLIDEDSLDYTNEVIWNWAKIHRLDEYEIENESILEWLEEQEAGF